MEPARTTSVLVADGQADARHALRAVLARVGYGVLEAETGLEALQVARRETPSLAVLDVGLAGVSGYEVCYELKHETMGALPVVLMSGHRTEPLDRVAGLLIGADDYIVKPFSPDELVVRVRKLIERAAPGDNKVNSLLTPRETQILRLLADGLEQREISSVLHISPKTVGTHVEHILGKLGARSRAQAIALAYRTGLMDVRPGAVPAPQQPAAERRSTTRPFTRPQGAA